MTIKEQLRQHYTLVKEIERLERDLIVIQSKTCQITKPLRPVVIKTTGVVDATKVIDASIMLRDTIQDLLADAYQQRNKIESLIKPLKPIERELIRCRYLRGKDWEEVCVTIGYAWAQTHRLHGLILKKLQDDTQ